MVIGIIGMGFVGQACAEGFSKAHTVETYDIDTSKRPTCNSITELVNKAELIFVCVPTPANKDGSANTQIVEDVVREIESVWCSIDEADLLFGYLNPNPRIVVIKSTVPPETTSKLAGNCEHIKVCFNPEFLTEANWLEDFMTQETTIIGYNGNIEDMSPLIYAYLTSLEKTNIIKLTSTEAEFVKYVANCFLASKVSLANEFQSVVDELDMKNVSWDNIIKALQQDSRLGKTHWRVPGPDGHYGFGGTCFPKDVQALLHYSDSIGVFMPILDAVWRRNTEIDRPEKDWENLKGRAVTSDD